ncbi:GrpB family protein [Cytobacillus horneckiae]|uniref:GrpB family protein n=1 Tax=Cytobacillus horneckiae TaxID=549687 RepID=UPI003D228700
MTKPMVKLSEYDSKWEIQFQYEKKRITDVLAAKVVGIEHIGSTSIGGLVSKPIIDIIIGVEDLNDAPTLVSPLSKIEYEYVPKPELVSRRFFRKGFWGQGICHLHVCEYQSNEWKEKLLFRDYLRSHREAAEAYSLLKQKLASKYQFDRQTYTKKKEPFIKYIIEKASREIYTT